MADSIKKLIELFSKFPTVGPRTAGRFVFYLMGKNKEEIDEFAKELNADAIFSFDDWYRKLGFTLASDLYAE